MKLYFDLGNSNLKWTWESPSGLEQMHRLQHRETETWLDTLNHQLRPEKSPTEVWLVSVAAEEKKQGLINWVQTQWSLQPRLMTVFRRTAGVICGYTDTAQLGADRWAAIVAAYRLSPQGVCILDCGTACTLDVVTADGRHLGGYILPGIRMMRRALLGNTAMEMKTSTQTWTKWGQDTAACIELGSRRSIVALLEYALERLQAEGSCDPGVILTGGEAPLLSELIDIDHTVDEKLVLEGLRLYSKEYVA